MTPLPFLTTVGKLATETYSEFVPFQPDRPPSYLERRYTNEASGFVSIDDARLHYRDQGRRDGKTIVALHGAYSSLHTWEPWVEQLGEEYRIISLDMPGHGLTGPLQSERHTMSALVSYVERFCEHMDLSDIVVAGNSMGGAVAWRLSINRPDLLSHMILLNAGGATLLSTLADNLVSFGTDMVPRYFTPRMFVRMLLLDAYYDNDMVTDALVRRYHDLLCRTGNRRAVIEICRNYMEDHFDESIHEVVDSGIPRLPSMNDTELKPSVWDEYEIANVEVPTLFQWGIEDQWLPLSFGEEFADEVVDCRFIRYEEVGHVPMEENPPDTAADAAAFIESNLPV